LHNCITAGAAVLKNGGIRSGFTLLEVLAVVVIIGILATLAYSNLVELISTNRAKETAQTIRTFAERALIDAKRQNMVIRICITGNAIISEDPNGTNGTDKDKCGKGIEVSRELLNPSFSDKELPPVPGKEDFKNSVESKIRIGISGIADEGYFATCDPRGYCGGAVKAKEENSFKAYIKKGNNADWEAIL
jgi:prepilin-type N-terminal cleavage/methylation domain-containing protein